MEMSRFARYRYDMRQTAKTSEPVSPAPPAVDNDSADLSEDRSGSTLTTSVYEQLRSEILGGDLRPGQKLGSEALRQRFNIGGSPIREALNRLLAEGLVALEAQKGFRVAPISKAELSELVTARCWIDGAAITEAIKRYDIQWEENLVLALHRLSRTGRQAPNNSGRNTDWEAKHREFHRALVSGCGSRWVTRISEQLFDAAERYRLLAADQVSERNERDEHRAIVDACLERNADRAVQLLGEHYGATYKVIVKGFDDAA